MSSLFLHVFKLIRAFWSKPETVKFFFDPMLDPALAETVKSMKSFA